MLKDLESLKKVLTRDGRLIRLPDKGKAVFIGDTHGDFDATETVFRFYFKPGYVLIFLGDYVDRGKRSRENIEFLLNKKTEAPGQVYLLTGNHEGYAVLPFYPADFWENISADDKTFFSEACELLPYAAVTENGLIAVHGVPPDIDGLENINNIRPGGNHWQQLTWGDFAEMPGNFLGNYGGRPVYGRDYFTTTMDRLGKKVLIRAHQPHIKPAIFERHCLTLMTSHAYKPERLIAVADLEKPVIETVDELEVFEI